MDLTKLIFSSILVTILIADVILCAPLSRQTRDTDTVTTEDIEHYLGALARSGRHHRGHGHHRDNRRRRQTQISYLAVMEFCVNNQSECRRYLQSLRRSTMRENHPDIRVIVIEK